MTLRALVDTGNRLREPISGRSVIVADRARILAVLPSSLSQALQSPYAEKWLADERYATHIRLPASFNLKYRVNIYGVLAVALVILSIAGIGAFVVYTKKNTKVR